MNLSLGRGLSLGGLGKGRGKGMSLRPSTAPAAPLAEPKPAPEPEKPAPPPENPSPAAAPAQQQPISRRHKGPPQISPLIPTNSEEYSLLIECQRSRANVDALMRERKAIQKDHREWLANRKKMICQVRNETNKIQNPAASGPQRRVLGFTLETM